MYLLRIHFVTHTHTHTHTRIHTHRKGYFSSRNVCVKRQFWGKQKRELGQEVVMPGVLWGGELTSDLAPCRPPPRRLATGKMVRADRPTVHNDDTTSTQTTTTMMTRLTTTTTTTTTATTAIIAEQQRFQFHPCQIIFIKISVQLRYSNLKCVRGCVRLSVRRSWASGTQNYAVRKMKQTRKHLMSGLSD